LVDVDSEKWLNYAESASFLKRHLFRLEAKRVRKLESKIASRAKAVTLVSKEEVQVFRQFCSTNNVHAISNGVDLDYFHPATQDFISEQETPAGVKPFKLVFVGVLDYRANIEGLRWFCREIWPKVREKIPGIEMDLVGRRPGDAARQLAALPGVNLIGEVEDVRPYVWKADVVIAPLTIARGIQNKVLEAMALAKPIIATPQAIEGTGAVSGEQLLAFSDKNDWIAAITDFSETRPAMNRFSHAARAYVARDHVWEACLGTLPALLGLGETQHSFYSRTRECDARLVSMPRFS
jgi:sugar transferase (PEP-CTERM/EpsH1 system associated)